jgi:hypothetical protein
MRAEPWLDKIRHGINPSISFGCDYCATTRRKRDIACWPIAYFAAKQPFGRFRKEADIKWQEGPASSVANDPKRKMRATIDGRLADPKTRRRGAGKFIEQNLRILQVRRLEALGEPAADRGEEVLGLAPFMFLDPKPREGHSGRVAPKVWPTVCGYRRALQTDQACRTTRRGRSLSTALTRGSGLWGDLCRSGPARAYGTHRAASVGTVESGRTLASAT